MLYAFSTVSTHLHNCESDTNPYLTIYCRTSAGIGIPPPSIQHSDAKTKAALDSLQWVDLIIIHDVQRFLNRFHTSMFTQITAHGGVHESEVAMWETEFESLKPLINRYDSGTQISPFAVHYTQFVPTTNNINPRYIPLLPLSSPARNPTMLLHIAPQRHRAINKIPRRPSLQHGPLHRRPQPRSRSPHPIPHPLPALGYPDQRRRRMHHHLHPPLRLFAGHERARRAYPRPASLRSRSPRLRPRRRPRSPCQHHHGYVLEYSQPCPEFRSFTGRETGSFICRCNVLVLE